MVRVGFALDLHAALQNPTSRKDSYFDACINKLEFMLKSCDTLVLAGDLFHKARTEDVVKNRILKLLNHYGKDVYTIIGNHDIEQDAMHTLPRTSLGNLAYHKCVTILNPDKIWNISGLKVGVLSYNIETAKSQTFESELDVVIGHHFYEWTRDLTKSIEESNVAQYNTRYLILGHDHEPHPNILVNNTTILRFGSVMRDRLQSYTPEHRPTMAVFELKRSKIENVVFLEIPHTPFESAFRFEEKREFKKCTKLVSDIRGFLESMKLENTSKKTIGTVLKDNL